MPRYYIFVVVLMLILAVLPLLAIEHAGRKTGGRLPVWRKVLCVILFEVSFAPFVSFFLLGRGNMAFLDCGYFLLMWGAFCFFRFLLPVRVSVAAPIFFGLMLVMPLTLFLTASNGYLEFAGAGGGWTVDLSRGGNYLSYVLQAVYRVSWGVLPLLGFYALTNKRPS